MQRKKKWKKILNQNKKDLIDYVKGAQCNIFRFKQIVRFGFILSLGGIFFAIVRQLMYPEQWKWFWPLLIGYLIPPAGKESIIPLGINRGIPVVVWGISIWAFDLMVCGAIVTNWWIVRIIISHVKIVEKWTKKIEQKVQKIQKKKYGKFLPLALLLFMLFPLQGSGAITTSFLGSWLGFSNRATFLTVAVGSALSITVIILIVIGVISIF